MSIEVGKTYIMRSGKTVTITNAAFGVSYGDHMGYDGVTEDGETIRFDLDGFYLHPMNGRTGTFQQDIVSTLEEARIRKPDYDLEAYLQYNEDIFTLEDIANIHAEVPGHNDEDHWYWILELKDGRFVLTSAWCDYTGWDCQSGGSSQAASSAMKAAELAPEKEGGREIRKNLLAQVKGEQPFGLEVSNP